MPVVEVVKKKKKKDQVLDICGKQSRQSLWTNGGGTREAEVSHDLFSYCLWGSAGRSPSRRSIPCPCEVRLEALRLPWLSGEGRQSGRLREGHGQSETLMAGPVRTWSGPPVLSDSSSEAWGS